MFPSGNLLGATWNVTALAEAGHSIALEARGSHNAFAHSDDRGMSGGIYSENGVGITMYSPNINLVRSPLWGRAQEVFGEDPALTAALGKAFVIGAQAKDPHSGRLLAGACCKHLAAYDVENIPTDRVMFDAAVSSRDMAETYLPAFEACVVEADAVHVMCSFNSINGVPACGNHALLNGVLREQWGWGGFVVGDYDAWANMYQPHQWADNLTDAAAIGLAAGLDQEGAGTSVTGSIHEAVTVGSVTAAQVAASFRRLMAARLKLGMFDPPDSHAWNRVAMASECQAEERVAQARGLAEQGVAMYRNQAARRVVAGPVGLAVIGPVAATGAGLLGNYATLPAVPGGKADPGSILAGVRGRVGDGIDVIFQPGCNDALCANNSDTDWTIQQAANASKVALATVLVLGTQPWGGDDGQCEDDAHVACEGEGQDRKSIAMPGLQSQLAEALAKRNTGAPLICVLVHGGSLALGSLTRDCDAILDGWYPGAQGGPAIARVVFGDVSPAARSPVTWYKSDHALGEASQGNMDMYTAGLTYRFASRAHVEVPFGAGLSFTTFAYRDAAALRPGDTVTSRTGGPKVLSVRPCDTVTVIVTVANTGERASDEVVQLYLDRAVRAAGGIPAPSIALVNFTRLHLLEGSTSTVELTLTPKARSVVREVPGRFWEPRRVLQGGRLRLWIGGVQPGFSEFGEPLNVDIDVSGTADLSSCSK